MIWCILIDFVFKKHITFLMIVSMFAAFSDKQSILCLYDLIHALHKVIMKCYPL